MNRLWNRWLRLDWKFGLTLTLVVCAVRFVLTLNANQTGSYGAISQMMILSALTPFIFLSREGLRQIGLVKPTRWWWLAGSLLAGVVIATLLWALGILLYSTGIDNWYVYIGNSYGIPDGISAHDRLILFLAMAGTGMIFSPIGEEFFFRGIVHAAFANSFGDRKASLIDASAFAITHLSHFGIVWVSGIWRFLPIPALLWVAGMFGLSLCLFRLRQLAGSIWGAVAGHAGFNFAMIFWIFYGLN